MVLFLLNIGNFRLISSSIFVLHFPTHDFLEFQLHLDCFMLPHRSCIDIYFSWFSYRWSSYCKNSIDLFLSLGSYFCCLQPGVKPIWWVFHFRYCIFQFYDFYLMCVCVCVLAFDLPLCSNLWLVVALQMGNYKDEL